MEGKFRGKYRIPSARLPGYNYSQNGWYFITICTKNRQHWFGEVKNEQMKLSALGAAADACWREIPVHFPNVKLGAFVVMPNHVHGLLKICNAVVKTQNVVETQNFASLQTKSMRPQTKPTHPQTTHVPSNFQNTFRPQSKNIASIIRGFKIGVTKFACNHHFSFEWQPRFYDSIIWDDSHLHNVHQYILNNPQNWRVDKFF